ncbi:hypothetical protein Aperf_G00000096292 [Anoplocephala perfoliata]
MFTNLNIVSSTPRLLESPIHGTIETVPIDRRERVFKEHLHWFLHSQWCVNATSRRKICNDPRCQQLRPVVDHIKTCENASFCATPYCAITKECLAHFNSCEEIECCKCKSMKYALFGRFLPDVKIYPQPHLEYVPIKVRGRIIRQIITLFYPDPDYTDLQDEKLEKEICRARIIEALSYDLGQSATAYCRLISTEIHKIKGHSIA